DVEVVGDFGIDLHPPVHRAGMHDPHTFGGNRMLFAVKTVIAEIFALRRDESAVHALKLKPEHHDHISPFDPIAQIVINVRPPLFGGTGYQGWRPDQTYISPHSVEEDN